MLQVSVCDIDYTCFVDLPSGNSISLLLYGRKLVWAGMFPWLAPTVWLQLVENVPKLSLSRY